MSISLFRQYRDKAYQAELTLGMHDIRVASETILTEIEDFFTSSISKSLEISNFDDIEVITVSNNFNSKSEFGKEFVSHLQNGDIQFAFGLARNGILLSNTIIVKNCKINSASNGLIYVAQGSTLTKKLTPNSSFNGKDFMSVSCP